MADNMSGDYLRFNISQQGPISANLGSDYDTVAVVGATNQVRLTFTSAEIGNANVNDAGTLANQDGGLAVRAQQEDADGNLFGSTSRFDDEGISFISDGSFTFDVRDLVSGTARGDQFLAVRLGTANADRYDDTASTVATYINAGMGNDRIKTGAGNDFLVGGAGNDRLTGGQGDDSFIGGGGNDRIYGNVGNDTAIYNASTDGNDRVDLGNGSDIVNVATAVGISQIRLTFTSAEIGNDNARDAGTLTNQDGGLAVRMQIEAGDDILGLPFSRFDDEGIRFVSTGAATFDVRDLVSGTARGDQFSVVQLGTGSADVYDESAATVATYLNLGNGDDTAIGGAGIDFLVGGAGNDSLRGGFGNDSFIGGTGIDKIIGSGGDDIVITNALTAGADMVNLGTGSDLVQVSADTSNTQVRLTFTSAEIGNDSATDAGTLANQDGGLAVRLQSESGVTDTLTGDIGRYDDEGITFSGTGVTFDVRDLVSGTARGDQFNVVTLGTSADDMLDFSASSLNYYVNGGAGNDTELGGSGVDFLVGGAGDDVLNTGAGNDNLIGGGGNDLFVFTDTPGNDTINDFMSGADKIDLSAFGITEDDLTFATVGTNTLVGVDTTMDGVADFTITLVGVTTPPPATDFTL